jgi:hypothetical protein
MGLFIATPSYNGQVTFNVTSTRDIMPDIDFFVECLEESLNELKAAVSPARKSPARKSSARKSGVKKSRAGKSATKRKIRAVKS